MPRSPLRVGDVREFQRLLEAGAFDDLRVWPIELTRRTAGVREPALRVGSWRRSGIGSSRRKRPLAACTREELREAIEERRQSLAYALQHVEECRAHLRTLEQLDAGFDVPRLRVVGGSDAA